MKRVFVFEYLTGGGAVDGDGTVFDTLMPLGLSMRDAMVGDLLQAGFAVTAATCDRAPAPPAGAVACRASAGESMAALVNRQAARHDAVWLVAPETGGLLLQLQQCVGAARWLGCDAASTRLASSKQATLRHLAAQGLRTPLAFADSATRWVVKPDDGAGAVATTVHSSLGSAHAAQRAGGDPMTLEPWVDGEAMSMSLLCRRGSAELLSINRQRITIAADGRLAYCGVDVDRLPREGAAGATLSALARQVAKAMPGLHGFVGIDLVWHATLGPVIIEINPRVTCAYVGLSARLGRNLAAELMAETAEETQHADA